MSQKCFKGMFATNILWFIYFRYISSRPSYNFHDTAFNDNNGHNDNNIDIENGISPRDDANSDEASEIEENEDGEGGEEYLTNNSGLLPPAALDPFDERFFPGGEFDADDDIYEQPFVQTQLGRSDGQHDGQLPGMSL